MMTTKKKARKISSPLINELLSEITPLENEKIKNNMKLAARLDDLLTERNLGKSEFAGIVKKEPSVITKWLSGTHNMTLETLTEIAFALNIAIEEILVPKNIQQVIYKLKAQINSDVPAIPNNLFVNKYGDMVSSPSKKTSAKYLTGSNQFYSTPRSAISNF
jgi:transcriptional regulator with XRE-family HTH domain